ncbi:MAG: choice-of-anchor L domain-containing protein [Polyangiaceae bacterium]|nr:choice-of-anchor L domain-containing protein [Polyangiaceae bacterium]
MRSLTRRTGILGLFVITMGCAAAGCGDGTSTATTGSGAGASGGSAGSSSGGMGGEAGSGGSSGGAGGTAGQGGGAGQGGAGGGMGGAGGGGQGGGGQGGGSSACNPGETMPCYTGDPATNGVGECTGGTMACVNGQWDTTCAGEVLPSGVADVCDGKDEDCNGQVDDGFGQATCGMGVCQITIDVCANGQVQTCTPGMALPPKCDGFDEDCDGEIDEADEGCTCTDGATQACYSGALGTDGVGVCKKGVQTCVNGAWGACAGEVVPTAETCNALDDDCNGIKDDGLGQTTCGAGQCTKTVDNCVNGAVQQCVPGTPMLEECNNIDDDCNGSVDDGLGNVACGVGACRVTVSACAGGMPATCVPGNPTAELCDDVDNDCNGMVDDGNPQGGGPCTTPLPGICASGVQQCSFGTLLCVQSVQPVPEQCNGLDDNCNGSTDEGNPGGSQSCSTGLPGVCGTGQTSCAGGAITCIQTVFPAAESCDGIDNNCNGTVDDGNPGGGGVCSVAGQQGLCAQGTLSCSNGSLVCTQTVQPTSETCDNKDNDCDGTVDEGNPGGSQACTAAGQLGECVKGTTVCSGGSVTCSPGMPSTEVCDNKDNDCDGTVDDGSPGGGMACQTQLPGICSAGVTACSNGSIVCNAVQSPQVESCNGLDDNCNGVADENNPGSAQSCIAPGQQGSCALGTTTCSSGSIVCLPGPSLPEICDGADNDCDGTTDEGNPGGGQVCTPPGAVGECAKGITSCSGGALSCIPASPTTEICDGKDNDCDGSIDEGNPGGGGNCNTGNPGICSAGTVMCVNSSLTCVQNQMPAAMDTCANGLDDNCNGVVDENLDNDADGWGVCDGDCCDSPVDCDQPPLVNPGAIEVIGNSMNDDCDAATSDLTPAALCSTVALQTPTTPMKLVQAMDLCQTTTLNPPKPQKKWGVLSATLVAADGVSTPPVDIQRGVLANFGPNVTPRKGVTMAALSSGTARDETDPGFINPDNGLAASGNGNPPPVYLAAHGGTLQTAPGCTTANDANDSANLKVQIRVPTNAQSFSYKFKFYSSEYPEWLCTQYNDFYLAMLTSGVAGIPADKNISFDNFGNPVSVNNAFFDVCQGCSAGTSELVGTGVGGVNGAVNDGGGTVWLTTTAPIVPGENMTIEFIIWDTGDRYWDSTVLLDAFEWSINPGVVATTPG